MERTPSLHRFPLAVSSAYYVFFLIVLTRRIIWSVGDITDVIVPAVAALPWGALVGLFPNGRNGAFVLVAVLGTLNAASIWVGLHLILLRVTRPKPDTMLGLGNTASQPGTDRQ